MDKIRCAIAGATGIVGQAFMRMLQDHPLFELAAICASDSRINKKLRDSLTYMQYPLPKKYLALSLQPLDAEELHRNEVAVVFSALPSAVAGEFETNAKERGMAVFSNAGSHRYDAEVPILIPEINASHLSIAEHQKKNSKNSGFIITNANCTATGLCLALAPIAMLGIKELIVSSYQALSGAGYPGHPALEMAVNCIPYIPGEEEKVGIETNKIFGQAKESSIEPCTWHISPHCIRVPVPVGHMMSVHVEVEHQVTYDDVLKLFTDFNPLAGKEGLFSAPTQPIYYLPQNNRPQHRLDVELGEPERARGMAIAVGRLSVDKNTIRFITLSNNLIRGAAGGSVLNAELAYTEGVL